MKRIIRVGSRDSELAVIQARLVMDAIRRREPSLEVEMVTMKTTGDRILDRTLSQIGGKGLFVKELDAALLRGDVDITVHSYKDLPMEGNPALPVVALGRREDPRDVLILPEAVSSLDKTRPIGCASLRRQTQLQTLFPEMRIEPVRGNIQTRLRKLEEGGYSALVLAAAGILRLGLAERVSYWFSEKELLPAACQGIIAVQTRAGEDAGFLAAFDDPASHAAAAAERAFVRAFNGGCGAPVAAYCAFTETGLRLEGLCQSGPDQKIRRDFIEGPQDQPQRLGVELARRLKNRPDLPGSVALVGAGPGGRELLTLRGAELLEKADTVVYDRLAAPELLELAPAKAERIGVGKESGNHPVPQEMISRLLLSRALMGKHVVRLKGGDPFLFGRGGEEAELLAASRVPFEVVPGVSSALAVPACAGIPVTHRGFSPSVHIFTGHRMAGKGLELPFETIARLPGTLVFLMGVSSLPELSRGLLEAGMDGDTPAAVVENGCSPNRRKLLSSLVKLPEEARRMGLHSPAIILVGGVCVLSERLDWFGRRPLFGRRVLVTAPQTSAGDFINTLKGLGAEVIHAPCVAICPLEENAARAVREAGGYRWLFFSSRNGADIFFRALHAVGLDGRALAGVKIGAAGKKTAQAIAAHGLEADCVPADPGGASLGRAAAARISPGDRALLCGALVSNGALERELRAAGAAVDCLPLYETVDAAPFSQEIRARLEGGEIFAAVFASGSAVEGFARNLSGLDFSRLRAACIGPETAAVARRHGMSAFAAMEASFDSLAELLAGWTDDEFEGKHGMDF